MSKIDKNVPPTTAGRKTQTHTSVSADHTFGLISELPTPSIIRPKYLLSQKGLPVKHKRKFKELVPHEEQDRRAFTLLLDSLIILTQGNYTLMGKLCGVSTPTIRRWKDTPPKQWYWPYVLFIALRTNYEEWKNGIRKGQRRTKRWNRSVRRVGVLIGAEQALSYSEEEQSWEPLPRSFIESLSYYSTASRAVLPPMPVSTDAAEKRLIVECCRSYHVQLDDFAQKHGYSRELVRRAADRLNMVKSQPGYGSEKKAYYTLPDHWGLDEEQGTIEVSEATAAEKKAAPVKFERRSKEYYEKLGRED